MQDDASLQFALLDIRPLNSSNTTAVGSRAVGLVLSASVLLTLHARSTSVPYALKGQPRYAMPYLFCLQGLA